MTTKKVKLKNSLNALNAKVAVGKQKSLPKLKVILANPYKCENAQLTDLESSELKNLIQIEITKSSFTGKDFARQNKICLGLASSLRAISNKKTSCVLISQSIKPKFIINQIGYLSREKSPTVPVYVLADLETISEQVFEIRALVIALPLQLPEKLSKWVIARTSLEKKLPTDKSKHKAACITPKVEVQGKIDLNYIYLKKKSNDERAFVPETIIKAKQTQTQTLPNKDWTGDYISFSQTNTPTFAMDVDETVFEKEKNKVLTALQRMSSTIKTGKINPSSKVLQQQETSSHQKLEAKLANVDSEEWDADYAISDEYMGLKVHKIQGNPNRKPKKKRKSKKHPQNTNI